ncbi:MAG: alpha amylase C-terminal domain-containing protein [Clostridia bacterium]|nr:alpha amylase C-terminal domain-containing protein [Clostridia bacterium]
MTYKILDYDPYLQPYASDIRLRMDNYARKHYELVGRNGKLSDFANGSDYFGFHKTQDGWWYREWAPAAEEVYLTGDMVDWKWLDLKLTSVGNGVFEIFLPGTDALYHGCHVKTIVRHKGQLLDRIPLYIKRVEQDPRDASWCGVIADEPAYKWKRKRFKMPKSPYIYECHIGMSQEKEGIGTYREFAENVLPRVKALGYNTIQLMAIMEHPYYGSFGYQVSSFFAPCSRFGTPNELKALIDAAHQMGIAVLLDLVHSHAVRNTKEGINEFDGTVYQFFHEGSRGEHPAWGTKLFNYNKNEVIHFLLSNLKYWLTEYHFDGFRFDGVTSMLYHDHGLGTAFTDYGKYFSMNTDTDAVTYLQLANELIREVRPDALTIAEDMSAMPGMCLPIEDGGIGFDYRLAMGIPDLWIRLLTKCRDEDWDMWNIWGELTGRRPMEKYIGYAESHDQALVGDKTIMFRLCDSRMYTEMYKDSRDPIISRGMKLHKLIRLATISLGGEGYLNFMGNEFGHPEWIDFPREGNGWSYFYCRRQWHLADDENLKYKELMQFDGAMLKTMETYRIFTEQPTSLYIDNGAKVLVYKRGDLIFVLNFNPTRDLDYLVTVPKKGTYKIVLGTEPIATDQFTTQKMLGNDGLIKMPMHLPARSGFCLEQID